MISISSWRLEGTAMWDCTSCSFRASLEGYKDTLYFLMDLKGLD